MIIARSIQIDFGIIQRTSGYTHTNKKRKERLNMLRSANEITGYRLYTKDDDDVGTCKDFLFDDRWWTIRHMLAETGGWLIGKQVLISPMMITRPDWKTRSIFLNVSKDKIENCPLPFEDEPVSREHERKISMHYAFPQYWNASGLWGTATYPYLAGPVIAEDKLGSTTELEKAPTQEKTKNHLRSLNEVTGYHIKAKDGNIGHVEDFIMDDETWALRYVIVDTRNWLPGGKKVLLPLALAASVNWENSTFEIDLTQAEIKKGPEFDPEKPINVEYETRVYDFYGKPFNATIDKAVQQHIANPFE